MANFHLTEAHKNAVTAALRLANAETDCDRVIDNCAKHARRYLKAKRKELMKSSPRDALAHSKATLESIRGALEAIEDWDTDTCRRVKTMLGAPESGAKIKVCGAERLARIRDDMGALEQAVAYAAKRARLKIKPGAPSSDKPLRDLFAAWAREWQTGTGKPIRASKKGLTETANVVNFRPVVRTGAERRAFHCLLAAIGVEVDHNSMSYLLAYARSASLNAPADVDEDSDDFDQQPNEAA